MIFLSQNSYQCPFCNNYFPLNDSTSKSDTISFYNQGHINYHLDKDPKTVTNSEEYKDAMLIRKLLCPACNNNTILVKGIGKDVKNIDTSIFPDSNAKQFPTYIPQSIRQDYEESCKIVNLSPKASATLARRCLQGMIRDYWEVSNKRNLYEEIQAIEEKVSPEVSRVLKGLKDLGNIGAHMEKDINLIINIDPGEAEKLIKLIEYLMKEWYINRYEAEQLFNDIIGIDKAKKEQKKNGASQ